jgi:hypothetical protein
MEDTTEALELAHNEKVYRRLDECRFFIDATVCLARIQNFSERVVCECMCGVALVCLLMENKRGVGGRLYLHNHKRTSHPLTEKIALR